MKILYFNKDNDKNILEKNLKIYEDININDYLNIFNEKGSWVIDNIQNSLLNALRQISYKFDYMYYLQPEFNSIYLKNNKNTFINKTEICNRINSIIINNNNENELNDYIDSKIGYIDKILNYNDNNYNYIYSNDIILTEKDLIILDKKIRIYLLPFIKGNFLIDNIVIKKEYNYIDQKYCNISDFTIIPLNDVKKEFIKEKINEINYDNNLEINNDFNKDINKYQINITTNGSISIEKLLPRYLNILYIKLKTEYIIEKSNNKNLSNPPILFLQTGLFLENLLIEYSYNNNIDILCKIIDDNVYCYNISENDIKKILNLINIDIFKLTSLLLNIDIKEAENNIKNNIYAKYYE